MKVENKIVASGELVIINDRYGVRINQVHTEETEQSMQIEPEYQTQYSEETFEEEQYVAQEQNQNYQEASMPQEKTEEEDFDYSDFDVDEDDL